MNLKGWATFTSVWLLLAPAPAYTGDQTGSSRSADMSGDLLRSSDMPTWLRRTHINFDFNSQQDEPILWFQPIYTKDRDSFFFQGQLSNSSDENLNLGLGYRHLMPGKRWLLGANAWYDSSFDFDQEHVGLGVEAIGEHVTLRSNYYSAISGWKAASSPLNSSSSENVLNGWNVELEAPLPYVPSARLSFRSFEWSNENSTDTGGHTLGVRMNPSNNLEFELGVTDDSASSTGAFTRFIWHFGQSSTSATPRW
ncbi:MAG: inverse autotransporter beta domain-containing protein [Candidatus Sedimenticola sp. (ex Thyasira tokunagai)]